MRKTRTALIASFVSLMFLTACNLFSSPGFEKSVEIKIKNQSGFEADLSVYSVNQDKWSYTSKVSSNNDSYDFSLWEESVIKIESDTLGKPYPLSLTVKEKNNLGKRISKIEIILNKDNILVHFE